jgi:hypothetical protein
MTRILARAALGLHILEFRTRVLPTSRRVACIHAMHGRYFRHCLACGGDVHEYIQHITLEYTRWECHRCNFGTLAP